MTEEPVPTVIRIEHVEEAGKVFQDAFNAGDIDGLVSLFEPDAVLVPDPGKSFPAPMLFGKCSLVSWRPGHGSKESSYLAFIGWEISLWRRPNGRWKATMLTVIR
jgi:hypothetical protein